MPRHANQTSFKPGQKRTAEDRAKQSETMRALYATGVLKPRRATWSPEQRAKHAATKRRRSLGNVRVQNNYRQIMTVDGYRYEHRVLMEQKLGRRLDRKEIVHHINGDKLDNRLENLELMTHSEHSQHHGPENTAGIQALARYVATHIKLPQGVWSRKHANCVRCGQTKYVHAAHGVCANCHQIAYRGKHRARMNQRRKELYRLKHPQQQGDAGA